MDYRLRGWILGSCCWDFNRRARDWRRDRLGLRRLFFFGKSGGGLDWGLGWNLSLSLGSPKGDKSSCSHVETC